MEGYSVPEAATILGVPTERVWELLARGVLAGTSEGESGMRVYLQPRPAPAPAPIAPGAGWPNGNDEAREPGRELSPFRELLTEFRNLTERYGQALLALGESRGEVATLRSRVDLLEARMDLRLPMSGFTPPVTSSSWPSASVTRAGSPSSEGAPDEHGADEGEDELDRPARRRRSSQRRATESFAEALARAEDPTRSELPGASDVATALAALRDESGHAAGAPATEAVLPRELPAADLMPLADEESGTAAVASAPEPVSVATEPEPVAAAPHEAEPEPDIVAAEPEPVTVATDDQQPEPEVAVVEPEPIPVEQPEAVAEVPEAVVVAADEPETDREAVAEAEVAPGPEPEVFAPETGATDVEHAEAVSVDEAGEPEPVAVAAGERQPGTEVVDEPEPAVTARAEPAAETEVVVAEPVPEPDIMDVELESPPVGEERDTEEIAEDLVPAVDQPDAAEPIAWDRDRYTVDITDPDWFAGEEPGDPGPEWPSSRGGEDAPDAAVADTVSAKPQTAPEPAPASPAAHRGEETMLWFGRQPPAAEPSEVPPTIEEAADDGSNEMEVAGSGHRAQMPGSQELDDALAALNALGRDRAEPALPDAAGEQVEETAAGAWPQADISAWTPRPSSSPSQPATPASRAYRRLRRIFPG